MSNLEIHHKQFRSHSGHDSEENLITLCAKCHAGMHRWRTGRDSRLLALKIRLLTFLWHSFRVLGQSVSSFVFSGDGPGMRWALLGEIISLVSTLYTWLRYRSAQNPNPGPRQSDERPVPDWHLTRSMPGQRFGALDNVADPRSLPTASRAGRGAPATGRSGASFSSHTRTPFRTTSRSDSGGRRDHSAARQSDACNLVPRDVLGSS